ncbi:MAG: TIR domain-containing protein [Anaerolineales bacterium]|nr:TIR domain-containing protein [Anaerolineales bacterium]
MDALIEVLKKVEIFANFPEETLKELGRKLDTLSLPTDTILFKEGDAGEEMYIISRGKIAIYGVNNLGHEVLFDELMPGEYFGEMSLLDNKPRSAGARTVTKSELLKLRRDDFFDVLNQNPKVALQLATQFSERLRGNVQLMEHVSRNAPPPTVNEEGSGVPVRVFISYSRRDKEFVLKLHEALVAQGFETWVDWEGIPLGTDWWKEIVEGIQNSDNFVFVISPDSVASKVCADELQTAIDNNKRLVPVLIREEKGMVSQIRPELQAINFTFMRTSDEFQNLMPQLLSTLRTDVTHVKTHTRLQNLALEWDRKKRSSSLTLRGEELENAEGWLAHAAGKQPPPSELHGEFIQASRRDTNRRQRQFLTGVVVALVVSLMLAIAAAFSYVRAEQSRQVAEVNQHLAQTAQVIAQDSEALARLQQATAEAASTIAVNEQAAALREAIAASTAEAKAVEQREEANEQRGIAEEQRQIADAQRLASQAEGDLGRGSLLTRSILLAIASMQKARNYQADLALRVGLDILPSRLYHTDFERAIIKVVYSSDGHWLAIAEAVDTERNGYVEIWDSVYGNVVVTLDGLGKITDMLFTPDGHLVTASEDHTVRVWDPVTGEEIYRLQHDGPVRAVAISRNGLWLASGGDDQYARTWNLRTGRQVASVFHTARVMDVDFSPGGSWVASVGEDRAAILWSPTTGVKNLTFYHDAEVDFVLFGPPGTLWMATATRGGTVTIWDPQNGARLAQLSHEQDVTSMAYSPNGKWLVTGSLDQTARIWEPETGRSLAQLRHDRAVLTVMFNANSQWVATGSLDGTARVWDPNTGREIARMEHKDAVNTLAFTANGLLLTTGSRDHSVNIWSPQAVGQAVMSLPHPSRVLDLDFNPDETLLATAGGDRKVRIWNVAQDGANMLPSVVLTITFSSDVIDVDFSRDGQFVATGAKDGQAQIWDVATGAELVSFPHEGDVLDVDFSRDGAWLVTGSEDGMARIWMIETGEMIASFEHGGPVGEVSLRADASLLATASLDKTARIWDIATLAEIRRLEHPAGVFLVNFVSETNWLVTVSQDNVVRFWDEQTGELLDRFFVDSQIKAVELNSTGTKLAVTGEDHIARVWEISTEGSAIALSEVSRVIHLDVINDVVFGADGNQIATASNDRTVLISLLIPDELIDKACSRVVRNFNQLEWTQFFEGEIYELTCPNLPPDPFAIEALKIEVGALGAAGEYDKAVDLMRHIQALDPTVEINLVEEIRRLTVETIVANGIIEAQEGEFDLAYADYVRVQTFEGYETSPALMEFIANLCYIGGGEGRAEKALPLCEAAMRAYPEDYLLYEARAKVLVWLDDYPAALADLEHAVALVESETIGEEEQFLLDRWFAWITQLEAGTNPFVEEPPN